jgi:hypothetical protein
MIYNILVVYKLSFTSQADPQPQEMAKSKRTVMSDIIGIMIPHACLCLSIITKLYGTNVIFDIMHHQPQS